ncbi:MAG: ATP-binding cassette domain-containing protein, partial [Verrucomicrobiota bacterium]
ATRQGKKILAGVDVELQAGQILAVIGPNGAGKSTLFKLLSGEHEPARGEVLLHGKQLDTYLKQDLAQIRVAMNQQFLIPFPLRVCEVAMMGRAPFFGWKEAPRDCQVVDQALERIDMSEFRDRDYTSLSGGEKQRTQLARALAQLEGTDGKLENKLLLLDEPSSALDLRHSHDVLKICREVADRGAAVLLIIHDINMALAHADEVLVLSDGRPRACGKVEEVLTESLVEEVFGVASRHLQPKGSGRGIFVHHLP